MEIKSRFDHFNINVSDLARSLDFYDRALGLRETGRKEAADGSFVLVYLGDGQTGFRLELTWLRDHADTPYELGENESHLCVRVPGDYAACGSTTAAWGASHTRITTWGSTSSPTPTTTGSKCCPRNSSRRSAAAGGAHAGSRPGGAGDARRCGQIPR